jgi:serine/threonine protein kinase
MDENLKKLLDVCLNVLPSKRPSPSELLNHEVFKIVENVQSTLKSCIQQVGVIRILKFACKMYNYFQI